MKKIKFYSGLVSTYIFSNNKSEVNYMKKLLNEKLNSDLSGLDADNTCKLEFKNKNNINNSILNWN